MNYYGVAGNVRIKNDDLTISIVIYHGDMDLLEKTITSVRDAVGSACAARVIDKANLILIDNRGQVSQSGEPDTMLNRIQPCEYKILRPVRNLGFGQGHNLAITAGNSTYHLILNPDVIVDKDAIARSVSYLNGHPQAGMVTPRAFYPTGHRQYLCKQYPSVADLFVRGLLPQNFARRYCHNRMARYEMRGLTEEAVNDAIQIAGGCFMFCRSKVLTAIGGFSQGYFLYFEDFDLSLRMVEAGWKIAYVPAVNIVHYGGHASRKGLGHLYQFTRSAARFFITYGWKLY
jgi:GT2 family glycosyltransferase